MRIQSWFTELLGVCFLASCSTSPSSAPVSSVHVGILHSRSGTMALSENAVAEAERLAIEEIMRRKAMIPILEERGVLFYPVQYEGQECSAFVICGGSVPNQQSPPAVA